MAKCIVDECSLDSFKDKSECALHCDKHDYHTDSNNGVLNPFFQDLINLIACYPFTYTDQTKDVNIATFRQYLLSSISHTKQLSKFAKESIIVIQNVKFPERDQRDRYDYLQILSKLGAIHFINCEFSSSSLALSDVKCFYQDCQFNRNWYIFNLPILANVDSVLYQSCIFHGYVSSSSDDRDQEGKYVIDISLFNNCFFKNKLEFSRVEFKAPLFNNTNAFNTEIKQFQLTDCIFQEKYILNDCKIDEFFAEKCIFNSKFEFKSNYLQDFIINDSNFYKLVDTFETKYEKFSIRKSIFSDFVGFEKCQFGLTQEESNPNISTFAYATFLSFVNFRNTAFHSGLDIKNINLKEPPNFLNLKLNSKNTNRETFRIIKNSFDKIGNNIEANKFFVLEMKKYKEELNNTNEYQEKLILFLSEKISDYGQSYLKPILWIVISSIIYTLLVNGYDHNTLYKIFPSINSVIALIANLLNSVASNILPFSKILKKNMEFISLVFYIIFTVLIWQTVVALKRHTRK